MNLIEKSVQNGRIDVINVDTFIHMKMINEPMISSDCIGEIKTSGRGKIGMTNAERIREMSNKELAHWIGKNLKICGCSAYEQCNLDTGITCDEPILQWLNNEFLVE